MIDLVISAFWLLCAVLGYGITYAYFTREFSALPRHKIEVVIAVSTAITGPVGLVVAYFLSDRVRHGLRFW